MLYTTLAAASSTKTAKIGNWEMPSEEQAYHWLCSLESQLKRSDRTDFLIETIQLDWLETPQRQYLYRTIVGLLTGLLCGWIYGMTTGWIGAGIGGVTYGLIFACTPNIYPIAKLKLSVEYARGQLWSSVLEGLWWGVVYGWIDALIGGSIWGFSGLTWGMVEVLIWGLVEGLIWGVCVPEFPSITKSEPAIGASAQNAIAFTFIGGGAWLLLYVLVLKAVNAPIEPLVLLVDSIGSGLFFGIYMGGLACLQHFVLRLLLWWFGDIPWNYTQFLNYATERGWLKREGRSYQFNLQWREDFVEFKLSEVENVLGKLN